MSSERSQSNDLEWQALEPAFLSSLAKQNAAANQRKRMISGITGALAMLCVVVGGIWMLNIARSSLPAKGGITCEVFMANFDAFEQQSLRDDDLERRMLKHLNDCPLCQQKFGLAAEEFRHEPSTFYVFQTMLEPPVASAIAKPE